MEVLIEVDTILSEVATAEVMALGCTGVEIRDHEVSSVAPGRTQVLSWHRSSDRIFDEVARICAGLGESCRFSFTRQVDTSWTKTLEQGKPMRVGSALTIRQPHHAAIPGSKNIVIAPGKGFGHGTHPTTVLSLTLLESSLINNQISRLLDLGTGTGILGLAALAWGVQHVWAVDIDPYALDAAKRNAEMSGYGQQITFADVDDTMPLNFDGCIANLYLGVLTASAERLAEWCKLGGSCIVSGFTVDAVPIVESCFEAQGFVKKNVAVAEPWIALEFLKKPTR